MSSAKNWCFTLNNYTEEEETKLQALGSELPPNIVYLIFGKEVGENGTKHLQGYISLAQKKRFNYVKEMVSNRCHIEKAKGSPAQNRTYCSKDGEYYEFGRCPGGKGSRNDIQQLVQAIKDGNGYHQIRDQYPQLYLRYEKAINRWIQDMERPREWTPEVIIHWGRTGTGKTRAVYEFIKHDEIYKHPGGGWFDGYTGQKVALFDDYNGGEFKLTYLLQLLDRYPMRVPVKGSFSNWRPYHIFITSNKPVEDWYPNCTEEHLAALKRRITLIKQFH